MLKTVVVQLSVVVVLYRYRASIIFDLMVVMDDVITSAVVMNVVALINGCGHYKSCDVSGLWP